jgi:hypothetical protein
MSRYIDAPQRESEEWKQALGEGYVPMQEGVDVE